LGTAEIAEFTLNEVSTCHRIGAMKKITTKKTEIGKTIFRQLNVAACCADRSVRVAIGCYWLLVIGY
jgi:hypothetical protein